MTKQTCCFTGHRPEKLPWGTDEGDPACVALKEALYRQAEHLITTYGVVHFISGMASGIDLYAAEAVLQLKKAYPVTLECALPFEEQAAKWPEDERERYFEIIGHADRETLLQRRFSRDCYQKRNRYMVDRSGYVIAVWSGAAGGTGNTIDYARQTGRRVLVIDPVRGGDAARRWAENRSGEV